MARQIAPRRTGPSACAAAAPAPGPCRTLCTKGSTCQHTSLSPCGRVSESAVRLAVRSHRQQIIRHKKYNPSAGAAAFVWQQHASLDTLRVMS